MSDMANRKLNEWGKYQSEWEGKARKALLGKKVIAVRYLTKQEMAESFPDWYSVPLAIFFDDGTWIIPQRDDEGNDGGALACSSDQCPTIPVFYVQ